MSPHIRMNHSYSMSWSADAALSRAEHANWTKKVCNSVVALTASWAFPARTADLHDGGVIYLNTTSYHDTHDLDETIHQHPSLVINCIRYPTRLLYTIRKPTLLTSVQACAVRRRPPLINFAARRIDLPVRIPHL